MDIAVEIPGGCCEGLLVKAFKVYTLRISREHYVCTNFVIAVSYPKNRLVKLILYLEKFIQNSFDIEDVRLDCTKLFGKVLDILFFDISIGHAMPFVSADWFACSKYHLETCKRRPPCYRIYDPSYGSSVYFQNFDSETSILNFHWQVLIFW